MNPSRMTRSAAVMMMVTLLAKVFGLLREVFLAFFFGSGTFVDAYVIASDIPTVAIAAVLVSISTAYVPIYSRISNKDGPERAVQFTNNLIGVLMAICLVVTALGEVFAGPLVRLFAMGFTGEVFEMTVRFTRVFLPCIFVMVIIAVFNGYLQMQERYAAIASVTIPNNIILVLSIWVAGITGREMAIIWGTVLGVASQLLYYQLFLRRLKYRYRFSPQGHKDPYIRQLLAMVVPVFIGESVNEVCTMVDKTVVSRLSAGSVSSLNYAYRIHNLMVGVMVIPIITVLYTRLADLFARGEKETGGEEINGALNIVILLLAPISGIAIVLAPVIVRILFERGSFDAQATAITARVLTGYLLCLVALGIRDIHVRAFFSQGDSRTPMVNGIICSAINIVATVVLVGSLGNWGAALGTSLSVFCAAGLLMFVAWRKKLYRLQFRRLLSNLLHTLAACAAAVFCLNLLYRLISARFTFGVAYLGLLLGACLLSAGLYLLVQFATRNRELSTALGVVREKLGRR